MVAVLRKLTPLRKLTTGGVYFNGINAYGEILNSSTLNSNELTIAFRIKMEEPRSWKYILSKAYGAAFSTGWTGWRFNNGIGGSSLNFDLSENSSNYIRLASGVNTYDGQEHEVIAWWDGTTVKLYVDGNLKAEGNFSGDISNTLPIAIASTSAFAQFSKCTFRTLLMYNKAIDLPVDFNNPPKDGLMLWLPFSENQGVVAMDYSGNGNDCQLYNCMWVLRKPFRVEVV